MGRREHKPLVNEDSAAEKTIALIRRQQCGHPRPVVLTSLPFVSILSASWKQFDSVIDGPLRSNADLA